MGADQNQLKGLSEGNSVDVDPYHFTCIDTPGHTPGHICLYEEVNKIIFVGDNILSEIYPSIETRRIEDDALGNYIRSLNRIKDLDVDYVYCGHGDSSFAYYNRIDEIITHHFTRMDEIMEIIYSQKDINVYDLSARLKWDISIEWEHFPIELKRNYVGETLAYLVYMLGRGMIESKLHDGIRRYSNPSNPKKSSNKTG